MPPIFQFYTSRSIANKSLTVLQSTYTIRELSFGGSSNLPVESCIRKSLSLCLHNAAVNCLLNCLPYSLSGYPIPICVVNPFPHIPCCISAAHLVQFGEVILHCVNVNVKIKITSGICTQEKGRIVWNQSNYLEG